MQVLSLTYTVRLPRRCIAFSNFCLVHFHVNGHHFPLTPTQDNTQPQHVTKMPRRCRPSYDVSILQAFVTSAQHLPCSKKSSCFSRPETDASVNLSSATSFAHRASLSTSLMSLALGYQSDNRRASCLLLNSPTLLHRRFWHESRPCKMQPSLGRSLVQHDQAEPRFLMRQ
jgi:hypothetical protein